ncbi:MAG: Fe-S cluster assembly protein SufD [Flavobacteriales bacterium Tduv]
MELKEKIISSYIAQQNQTIPVNKYVHRMRCKAIDIFEKKGFPTVKEEEWKYTNLTPVLKHDYSLFASQNISVEHKVIQKYLLDELDAFRLIFVDGVYSSWLSETTHNGKDICVLSNAFAQKKHGAIIKNYYGKIAPKHDALTSLNTAFAQDGSYIYIPKNILVEKPIQILYLSTGATTEVMLQPRNLIVVGKGSHVQIIERHQCLNNHIVLSNSVTEVYAAANSQVEYFKIQNDMPRSALIDHTFVIQEQNSFCSVDTFSFQGKFIRNNLNFYQRGERINSHLKGLTIAQGEQLVDHHTLVDHLYPQCESHEIYKGIFGGKTKGIFNGKIMVHSDAQKINAFQQNNNILLSKEACINSKPQLEIFVDDIKCSHGCTIGQLNPETLFYLRARGIPEKEAKAFLLLAFSEKILENINIPQLRSSIHKMIGEKLEVNLEFEL